MRLRWRWVTAMVVVVVGMALAPTRRAHGVGLLTTDEARPVRVQVAMALTGATTVTWSRMHLDVPAGPLAMLVPLPAGSRADWASEGWLEALEIASAPRVLPPPGAPAQCPGAPPAGPMHFTGDATHRPPLVPAEIALLATADEVAGWAAQRGLRMDEALTPRLADLAGQGGQLLAVRFSAPGGEVSTPTVRVVSPTLGVPALPLFLTRAGDTPLEVTAHVIGPGRARLVERTHATLDLSVLHFGAAHADSNLAFLQAEALAAVDGPAALRDSAGHGAWVAPKTGASVLSVYFDRAATYGDAARAPLGCRDEAAGVMDAPVPVGVACAAGALAAIDVAPCVSSAATGQIDPELLACGPGADDLALALSGAVPSTVWLTRYQTREPAAGWLSALAVGFDGGDSVPAEIIAQRVSFAECFGDDLGDEPVRPGTTHPDPRDRPAAGVPPPAGYHGCGSSDVGTVDDGYVVGDDTDGDVADDPYVDEGGCTGSPDAPATSDDGADDDGGFSDVIADQEEQWETPDSGSSGDSCSGESDGGYDDDGCSGESEGGYDDDGCSGDSGDGYEGDGCSGDSGDGYEGDGCSGDSGGYEGDGCSGDTASHGDGDWRLTRAARRVMRAAWRQRPQANARELTCRVDKRRRPRGPRLSLLVFALLVVMAPLRRLARPGASTASIEAM